MFFRGCIVYCSCNTNFLGMLRNLTWNTMEVPTRTTNQLCRNGGFRGVKSLRATLKSLVVRFLHCVVVSIEYTGFEHMHLRYLEFTGVYHGLGKIKAGCGITRSHGPLGNSADVQC